MSAKTKEFARLVEDFFQKYLVSERDLSSNTVLSYRDALKLLLSFISRATRRSPDRLTLEDFDADRIRSFLGWLASERRSSNRTVNQRLAALKTFFRYVASRTPEHLDRCRSIREIANRRVEAKIVDHLDQEQMADVLEASRHTGHQQERNAALITLMLNTGARVQEVVDLDVERLDLDRIPKVRIRGKGRKCRDVPLWKSTVHLLRAWLRKRQRLGVEETGPLFVNRDGKRLSRSGIAYLVDRVAAAAGIKPTVDRKHITPHHLRHTTAMELLRAKADITVVAAWLGHATLGTTHQYVEIDLRMKQALIAASTASLPVDLPADPPCPRLLEWLQKLGKGDDYEPKTTADCPAGKDLRRELHITDDST